jgi:hypothetical protein
LPRPYGGAFFVPAASPRLDPAIEQAFGARRVPLAIMTTADPAIGALYERRLVLVRPDGHVAWRGDALPADPYALVDRIRGA